MEMPEGWKKLEDYGTSFSFKDMKVNLKFCKEMAEVLEGYATDPFYPEHPDRTVPAKEILQKFKEWK